MRFNMQIAASCVARWQTEQQTQTFLSSVTQAIQAFNPGYQQPVTVLSSASANTAVISTNDSASADTAMTMNTGRNEDRLVCTSPHQNQQQPHSAAAIATESLMSVASPTRNLIIAPFCIACQAHTANVAILSCGHICLCKEHAETMRSRNQLDHCPLCRLPSNGVCQLQGMNR